MHDDPPIPVGTWTIIHSDGTSTTIKTERTGSGGSEPEIIDDDNDDVITFEYMDQRLRVFPIYNVFEISFVPEDEDE